MDSVRADTDLVQTEWDACARELQAAHDRVHTQSRVAAVSAELGELDRALEEQDRWLESTAAPETCDEDKLRSLSGECRVRGSASRIAHLISNIFRWFSFLFHSIHLCVPQSRLDKVSALNLQLEQLNSEVGSLGAMPSLRDNMVVVSSHHTCTLQRLRSREQEIDEGTSIYPHQCRMSRQRKTYSTSL